jgi:hypothetical protein
LKRTKGKSEKKLMEKLRSTIISLQRFCCP